MRITDQFKDNKSLALTKRLIPWTICVLLPIALIHSFFYPLPFSPSPKTDLPHSTNNNITYRSSLSASPPSSAGITISMHNFFLIFRLMVFLVSMKLSTFLYLFCLVKVKLWPFRFYFLVYIQVFIPQSNYVYV